MTRRIDKSHFQATRCHHRVSADVLSDSTRFAGGDLGLTNRIKQTGFTVVNVTHDGHHWWTRHEIFGLVFFFGGGLFGVDFFGDVGRFTDGDGLLELHRQQFDGVFFNN